MKNTGVVIFSLAGSVPPDEYLQKALENNKSSIGAAALITIRDDHNNVHHHEFEREAFPQTVSLEALKGMLNNYKDYDVLLHMGNSDAPVGPHDLQPFVALEDKDGQCIAVGAIEGEFHPTVKDDTTKGRTEDGLLIESYLKPKFADVMALCNGNLSEFFKKLKSPIAERELKSTWGNNGTIAVLGLNGESGRVEHNAAFRRFDWGWTTRHYGYKAEELKIDTPKTEPVKQGMFGKVVQAVVDNLPINAKTTSNDVKKDNTLHPGQPIPAVGSVATELKKALPTDTAVKANEGGKLCRPPLGIMGDKTKLRKWYDRAVGHEKRPDNFMEGPEIFVTNERIKEKNLSYREVVASTTPVSQPTKKEEPKTAPVPVTTPVVVPDGGEVTKVGETTVIRKKPLELVPIIPAENKMKINARLLAIKSNTAVVGVGSQEGMAPSKIQGVENDLPNFSQQLGIKREDLLGLSYSDIVGLTRDFPDDMAILVFNLLDNAKKVGLQPKADNVEGVKPKTSVPSSGAMFGKSQKAG